MKFVYPLLVVLLTVFAVAPLEYPGAFQSHTGLLAYYNLIDLDQNPLQVFNWAPVVGGTFDLFRTDGALPYLIAEIFHLIGFSYLASIKLVYALAWIISGLTMFALARQWLSEAGALLAAVVYVYLPFHIATIYVRGAFAESIAWALMPLILFSLLKTQTIGNRLPSADCLLLTALLFLTQPGIAIFFSIFAFVLAIIISGRRSSVVGQMLVGLLVGALLYLPTLLRYGISFSRDGFNANFVYPFQIFSALWGFGTSTGNYLDQFPLQLGVVPIGLAIVAVALAWQTERNRERERYGERSLRRTIIIFISAAIIVAMLTFEIASPLWNLLGIFVTSPWQILAFAGCALAIVAGSVIDLDERFARPAMLAFFVALPIVASYSYLAPRFVDVKPTRPAIAFFNHNEIALLDYRIVGPLRHGATLRLHLTWQALRPVDYDYTMFVRAVHDDGKTYGQSDAKPRDGESPTLKWTPGQVITDTHTIQIDVDGPTEGYHIEFGMYNAATGRRALTETGADSIRLPRPGDPEPIISEQLPPQKQK